ncbi:MAG: uroporphyrinogen decarboxylase [Spirochaetales bacterium]|nr:uroporphyrinogen decarboxylase [Spirochaetales bacterium]
MSKKILIQALQGERTDRVPFWYMRQAGRYLPEYNRIRSQMTFMELTRNVSAAVEVSQQPYLRFGMDGLIMFSDILTPLSGAGIPLHFAEKKGPVLEKVIRSNEDLAALQEFEATRDTPYVADILQKLRQFCDAEGPALIGFGGAPFTLASYLIEGGSTRSFDECKRMLFGQADLYRTLALRLTEISINYLSMQIQAGAEVIQIFDSWGGVLSVEHYQKFAAPYSQKIIEKLKEKYPKIPVILFVGNAAHLTAALSSSGAAALSLDWRVPAAEIRQIPPGIALQGNLDPLVLYGSQTTVQQETRSTLTRFENRPGYVFNLGHGIHPATPIENVETMVRTVRDYKLNHS